MRYVPALDGLRAIAIMLVMGVHFHQWCRFGWVGVQLFFVLSGFLITRILMSAKEGALFGSYLKVFLARRALRIFPLYFAFVVLLEALFRASKIPATFPDARPWLWSYTLNVGHMLGRVAVDDMYSHFWSLAVEEQFYLVWPLVVWGCSRAVLGRVVIGILLASPLLRGLMVANGFDPEALYFFTPGQLDAFAAGAAITVFDAERVRGASKWLAVAVVVTVTSGVLANWEHSPTSALLSLGQPYFLPRHGQYVWGYSLINLCSALLVVACLQPPEKTARLGTWFSASWLVAIGRISYGIYVFHRPLVALLWRLQAQLGIRNSIPMHMVILTLYGGLSFALAWISFRFFESRFTALKARFEVHSVAPVGAARTRLEPTRVDSLDSP